jgi:hypothetical protein
MTTHFKKILISIIITGLIIPSGYIISKQSVKLSKASRHDNATVKEAQIATKKTEQISTKNDNENKNTIMQAPQKDFQAAPKQQFDQSQQEKKTEAVNKDTQVSSVAAASIGSDSKRSISSEVSRNTVTANPALPWFGQAENIFSIGTVATVTDVATGLKFKLKRTYGYNHADCETLRLKDTEILKQIYGGQWSWERRAVIVEINGQKIAASITGMPHAGRDDQPANIQVSNRSKGYGYGYNLDAVKGNGMDGHIDIHFLGSKTHGTNRVDPQHQAKVKEAAAAIR